MKLEPNFIPRRFLLLLKNEFFINRYFLLIYAVAAMGILLFIYGRDAIHGQSSVSDPKLCFIGLYLVGLLFTCRLFSDLQDEPKNIAWQTLPASLVEKYSSQIVLSNFAFTVGWLIFFYFISYGAEVSTRFLMGEGHHVLTLFDKTVLVESYRYWVFHSLLVFGVIYFKKNAPVKTVLSLVVYLILLVLVYSLIVNLVFGNYSDGLAWHISFSQRTFSIGTNMKQEMMGFLSTDAALPVLHFAKRSGEIIFWFLMMPFFWILGFIRLKEMEV